MAVILCRPSFDRTPILKPTLISELETMWLWNDYLLPYLVLDRKKYMTIPILDPVLPGSYESRNGTNDGLYPYDGIADHHCISGLP